MIKKRLFYVWVLLLFALNVKAQNCVPDTIVMDAFLEGRLDVFPRPGTTFDNSLLNGGCVGEDYVTTFTFAVPDTITMLTSGDPSIIIDSVRYLRIDSMVGLPPGTMYECEPDDCIFANTIGCVSIIGQPSEAGIFSPLMLTTIELEIESEVVSLPVNIPYSTDIVTEDAFMGFYYIDICQEDMCNSCTVGVNDALENTINIQQNIPNPFHENTNIIIHSKESDTFDFRVVNMMGKVIHNEQIYLFSGENNISFDGSKLPSGVYFYSIGKNGNYTSKRMAISRM